MFYTYPMNKNNNQNGLPAQAGFATIQIILSIRAGVVSLGGIVGGVLYFSKTSQIPTGPQGKCGDGVCGPAEKANQNLCPQDCEKEQSVPGVGTVTDFQIPKTGDTGSVKSSSEIIK